MAWPQLSAWRPPPLPWALRSPALNRLETRSTEAGTRLRPTCQNWLLVDVLFRTGASVSQRRNVDGSSRKAEATMVKKSGAKAKKRSQSPSRRWSTNAALMAKLAQLNSLAEAGNREAFARAFVPLDLSEDELMGYVSDLQANEDQWIHVRRLLTTLPPRHAPPLSANSRNAYSWCLRSPRSSAAWRRLRETRSPKPPSTSHTRWSRAATEW